MTKLSSEARSKLPSSEFGGPHRSYPVNDPKRAKAALMLINKGGLDAKEKAHTRRLAEAMLHRHAKVS